MKNLLFFILVMMTALSARSQVTASEPVKTGDRFFVGVSYTYMSLDMELNALSLHSVWYGEDLGTTDLTADEIDEINAAVDRSTSINNINIEAGMAFINKPGAKWHFNGKLCLGIAGSKIEVQNNSTDTLEYSYDSGLSKPAFSLGLDVGYAFNDHWALSLRPMFMGTMGKNSDITDNINPEPVNVTQTTDDKYYTYYEHASLTADYTAGHFTVSVGPGFYWVNSKHIYSINRVNDLNGDTMNDEITRKMIAKSFIDGSVAVEWKIIEALTFYAVAGIGPDLMINTGIHYNF
jgi:hypothetical protein